MWRELVLAALFGIVFPLPVSSTFEEFGFADNANGFSSSNYLYNHPQYYGQQATQPYTYYYYYPNGNFMNPQQQQYWYSPYYPQYYYHYNNSPYYGGNQNQWLSPSSISRPFYLRFIRTRPVVYVPQQQQQQQRIVIQQPQQQQQFLSNMLNTGQQQQFPFVNQQQQPNFFVENTANQRFIGTASRPHDGIEGGEASTSGGNQSTTREEHPIITELATEPPSTSHPGPGTDTKASSTSSTSSNTGTGASQIEVQASPIENEGVDEQEEAARRRA